MAGTDPELLKIREQIAQAVSDKRALDIAGGATRRFYGQKIVGDVLSMAHWRGIVSYEPTELVVTVRAGTPLAQLQDALAEQGQHLPFEPPSFGADSTVGGMVASGLSGPRRPSAGSVRDYVLGTNMIDSGGQWLAFGGQVMKNVAGYDLSRLLCGSLGILGVIAEVSLKVLPVPAIERTVSLSLPEADAIRLMNQMAGEPMPVSATSWHQQILQVRFSGASSAVDAAANRMQAEHGAGSASDDVLDNYWQALRDQQIAFFEAPDDGLPLWRLSVPSTAAVIDLPGEQLIEWGGALRWWRTDAPATAIRAAAHAVGGSATLFRGGDKSDGVFDPLSPALAGIHRRLKEQLDPHGIFNPGRMYPDL